MSVSGCLLVGGWFGLRGGRAAFIDIDRDIAG